MLILTRRVGESIVIGGEIVVTVIEAGRDHVRIGVDAPRHVDVHRQEVYLAITEENHAAGRSEGVTLPSAGGSISADAMPRRPRRDR
jgi:carbon storage regulator